MTTHEWNASQVSTQAAKWSHVMWIDGHQKATGVIRPDAEHIADMGDLAWSITGTASRSASSTTAAEVSQRRRARKPRIDPPRRCGGLLTRPINPSHQRRRNRTGGQPPVWVARFSHPVCWRSDHAFAWVRGASVDTMGQRFHGQLAERGHPRPSARHCLGPRNRVDTAVRSRAPESTAVVPDYLSAGGGETCST
jgi:hypothetical protein